MIYSDLRQLVLDAKNLATGITDMELKSKINEIINAMYELQDENRDLREENHELKNAQRLTARLDFRDNAYYDGEVGPYCSACWDGNNKLVRMKMTGNGWNEYLSAKCPHCKNTVKTNEKDPDFILGK